MGYTTEFNGRFHLDKPLLPEHAAYLEAFSNTRRMKRDAKKASLIPDGVRALTSLPVGRYGEYFVGGGGWKGQGKDESIMDYNNPPPSQPGLWCQWVPSETGEYIEWDGEEKFYYYVEWLEYIIEHFLIPWGYTLNGVVEWRGEDWSDTGLLSVSENVVSVS